jgi:hypothetical protein
VSVLRGLVAWGVGLSAYAVAFLVHADVPTPVPMDQRGTSDAERSGLHDASNIRTTFWNYGMVGDFPADPGSVDLSVFHSVEVPKGSGANYSDGITPFVLARVQTQDGQTVHIMETGFRERQGISPYFNRVMRFEPRPGYLQPSPTLNPGRSPAISNDPRTWPGFWPDRLDDPDDPGWSGSWNGFFGKQIVADQESYMVLDDQYYDAWAYYPDSRDATRRGLGLRIEVRGFQWSNPQARNVIFWLYDITNEGTVDYDDNIIFGLYMDSGVGGSALSCDGIFESDDDNAFFDREFNEDILNLVYTWDRTNRGVDLSSNCATTGYLGYAYLETPGNALDSVDNDEDGITDELRDGGPGQRLVGITAIDAYIDANYDRVRFIATYGPLEDRAAYRDGDWWTGDEDMDWSADLHDLGADGLKDTGDAGEGDGMPTEGEPSFDGTDLHESDQIGLTGFKINRIRPGQGNPNQETDNVLFFTEDENWPERLYDQFNDPDSTVRFDDALSSNYNIGFLFASGPFTLAAGKTERFSLALAYGANIEELRTNVQTVQQIYDANYRFAVPPPLPTVSAEEGDGFVRLSWDDVAERGADPVTGEFDFEGYRIYRSTDPEFRDPQVISTGTGTGPIGNGRPIAQFDLVDGIAGYSEQVVEGVAYWLGTDTGITHTWTDSTVTNGQQYYYAVTAYDYGSENLGFAPSENSITASIGLRTGLILPANVVAVRPNPRVSGFIGARTEDVEHVSGRGNATVEVEIVNSTLVPEQHVFTVSFTTPAPDSLRATAYVLTDTTDDTVLFEHGAVFDGARVGPVGAGILPIVDAQTDVRIDAEASGFRDGGSSNVRVSLSLFDEPFLLPTNYPRPGYPENITITFADAVVDTGIRIGPVLAHPAKFRVVAHAPSGDVDMDFRFNDLDADGTLSRASEFVDVVTYDPKQPGIPWLTWRFAFDSTTPTPITAPRQGDVFDLIVTHPVSSDDVFVFRSNAERVDESLAREQFHVYVVPNPYVGSASFEPQRFADSGRGERRIEFRGLPARCTIRVYNVRGDLVQTLRHDGSKDGFVAWDLRTKDNLDVAAGLYIYHVDADAIGKSVGKFAVIK